MGRVLLPPFLREVAGITDQAKVVGANGMFEIWNPDRFDEVTARTGKIVTTSLQKPLEWACDDSARR